MEVICVLVAGCAFLLRNLLHVREVGAALPFALLLVVASIVRALHDGGDAMDRSHRGIRIALLVVACLGGIASSVPEFGIARLESMVWLGVLVCVVRALQRLTPQRLTHVAIGCSRTV